MFSNVCKMNQAFGNPAGNPLYFLLSPGTPEGEAAWAKLKRQCGNIAKEYEELQTALAARDLDKVRDALCDINVFSLGAHHFMGIDADVDMAAVLIGVMTRFCKDEDCLRRTCAKYDAMGVTYTVEGAFPRVYLRSDKDQGDGEYPKGKFLKSADFSDSAFYNVASVAAGNETVDKESWQGLVNASMADPLPAHGRQFMGMPKQKDPMQVLEEMRHARETAMANKERWMAWQASAVDKLRDLLASLPEDKQALLVSGEYNLTMTANKVGADSEGGEV